MIKRIGTEARQDLEEMLDGRVYLDLHVKVRAATGATTSGCWTSSGSVRGADLASRGLIQ